MNMRSIAVCGMIGVLSGCQSSYTYEPIVPNPENLEMANARCNLMASSAEQGVVAWGTPEYVAGAQIGNAIGNAVRVDNFMKQCMTLQGWRRVNAAPKTSPAPASKPTLTADEKATATSLLMFEAVAGFCGFRMSKDAMGGVAEAKRLATPEIRRKASAEADKKMRAAASVGKATYCKKVKAVLAENGLA